MKNPNELRTIVSNTFGNKTKENCIVTDLRFWLSDDIFCQKLSKIMKMNVQRIWQTC